ncbi:hypothetical protein HPP92_022099 [Vanilla planifolia]|uniref:Non-haem dioxygenase N-terminal domain-containing protein n=1 Tax=Vanilla planifolia TaxID=51239 RepID=A0A835UDL5_VANPL|nr:hypothetical protein HPP92_022412 [Vanilla planifolia]KAG0458971.1 hypothetical protein HPP92_022099 [Vanilla planifolia]
MAAFWSPCEPPFQQRYSFLFSPASQAGQWRKTHDAEMTKECDLPLIDLSRLHCGDEKERMACVAEIGRASSEWGFFQVVNHGIQSELLQAVGREQRKLFGAPFEEKTGQKFLNGSYRWGNPTAISLAQFSWSESFHLPLSVLAGDDHACHEELEPFRSLVASFSYAPFVNFYRKVIIQILECSNLFFFEVSLL